MSGKPQNFTFDGATARVRLGAVAIPCTKATPPKESMKREAVRRLGEQVAKVRTLGIYECDGAAIELESAVFASLMLPRLPKHGWSAFEFVTTVTLRHPIVGSPYSVIWDRCSFAGVEAEALEASEKANKMSLPLSVVQVFHRGADGIWKSLAIQPSEPTPQAQAFMF